MVVLLCGSGDNKRVILSLCHHICKHPSMYKRYCLENLEIWICIKSEGGPSCALVLCQLQISWLVNLESGSSNLWLVINFIFRETRDMNIIYLKRGRFFALIMNKVFMWAPNIKRKITTHMTKICNHVMLIACEFFHILWEVVVLN